MMVLRIPEIKRSMACIRNSRDTSPPEVVTTCFIPFHLSDEHPSVGPSDSPSPQIHTIKQYPRQQHISATVDPFPFSDMKRETHQPLTSTRLHPHPTHPIPQPFIP